MTKIAVIGAGGTGVGLSAILASRGKEVILADDAPCNLSVLEGCKNAEILRTKGTYVCEGRPVLITENISEAAEEADLVVCCTVSNRDKEIAEKIAPVIDDNKAVLLGAGNGGSIIYQRVFEDHGKGDILVAETAGNFFPSRVTAGGESTLGLPLSPKGVTSFPPSRAAEASERFAPVWELKPCESMIEALFNGPNLICHSAGCITNLALISRNEDFNLFTDGLCEGFLNITDALWEEKRCVYEAMECTPSPAPRAFLAAVMDKNNPDYEFFRMMSGPYTLSHRYITEDVPNLFCLFLSIARAAGVRTPLFEGIIGMLSAACKTDFYANGRTLENLGWGSLSRTELIKLFHS